MYTTAESASKPGLKVSSSINFGYTLQFFSRLSLFFLICLPALVYGESFKFRVRNTSPKNLKIYYKLTKKSGSFKVRSLFNLKSDEERMDDISVGKGDTIAFYGQDVEDEISIVVKKDFGYLTALKGKVISIPIVFPVKESANFESLEGLSLKLEHNKVLNFLLKMDSTSMSSLSLLENNFQNVYPLGTFIFVDTKTNRLLLPPLEPSFWNNSENYLTIQDSLYDLVNTSHHAQAGAQVAYFVAKLFDSLGVNNTAELQFKGRLSLIRWKPSTNANIYQIFNDRSVQDFIQNCYAQIDNPDEEFPRYRLYFLSSYERIDDLEIFGRQFYNFGNETDLSMAAGTPGFQLLSSNLGLIYTKNRIMSNYYSVQNAVLRTKAFDFTNLLYNGFKNSVKNRIRADAYAQQHQTQLAIIGEYKNLVDYNPDPNRLTLIKLGDKDTTFTLTPIITTVNNLQPYAYAVPDTSKQAQLTNKNAGIDAYNSKVKIFNAHLKEINDLIRELGVTNEDIAKLSQPASADPRYAMAKNGSGMMNEIVVSNKIIRKE
jgi:hypothetical protein